MDADRRGWLSPGEANRLRRSLNYAVLSSFIGTFVIACLLYRIYEKDRQIDGLIKQSQSLVQSVEHVINQSGLPELQTENLH